MSDSEINPVTRCLSLVRFAERFSLTVGPPLFILGVQRPRSETGVFGRSARQDPDLRHSNEFVADRALARHHVTTPRAERR